MSGYATTFVSKRFTLRRSASKFSHIILFFWWNSCVRIVNDWLHFCPTPTYLWRTVYSVLSSYLQKQTSTSDSSGNQTHDLLLTPLIYWPSSLPYGVLWPSGLAHRTQVLVLAAECGFESRPWHLCPWARDFTIIASLDPGENGYLWGQSWLLCLISPYAPKWQQLSCILPRELRWF